MGDAPDRRRCHTNVDARRLRIVMRARVRRVMSLVYTVESQLDRLDEQ